MVLAFFLLRGRVKAGRTALTLPSTDSEGKEEELFSKEPFYKKVLRIDWIGAALFMAGGILILLALNWGSTEKWNSVKVIVCFVIGGLLVIACLAWEYFLERKEVTATSETFSAFYTDPMIPLALFKSLDVCVVQYAIFVSGMIMLVMFYFVAIFMTIVTGLSPTKAGVQLIYFAPGMVRTFPSNLVAYISTSFFTSGRWFHTCYPFDQNHQTSERICVFFNRPF